MRHQAESDQQVFNEVLSRVDDIEEISIVMGQAIRKTLLDGSTTEIYGAVLFIRMAGEAYLMFNSSLAEDLINNETIRGMSLVRYRLGCEGRTLW